MSSIGSTPARRRDFREHSAFRGGHVCVHMLSMMSTGKRRRSVEEIGVLSPVVTVYVRECFYP